MMHLTLITNPSESVVQTLHDNLYAHNREQAPVLRHQREAAYAVCQYADDRTLTGGAVCRFEWGWLYVDTLYVTDSMRGRGCGSRILQAAEQHAAACGVSSVYLYTADFQGRAFYEKQGYQVSGILADKPPGHTLYYLQKHGLQPGTLPENMVIQTPPEPATVQALEAGLLAHADAHVPFQKTHEIAILLRDDSQTIHGGLSGHAAWNWFDLNLFWIAQAERGHGYGSRMLAMLDAFCRNERLRGIVTGTGDFQAYPFYRKEGFQVISTLDEHPPGHTSYLLAKPL